MTHQTGNFLVPQHSGEPETKPKKIRCRQCGKNALENLVICPYCGRELYPAAPRWLVWGAPVTLVLLFLIVMTTWGQTNPVTWTANQVSGGRNLLTNIVRRIEPRLVSGNPTAVEAAIVAEPNSAAVPADVAAGASVAEDAGAADDGVQIIEIAPETATQTAGESQPVAANVEAATQVPTLLPTNEISSTMADSNMTASSGSVGGEVASNPAPTETPEPTLTAEPTVVETATESPTRAVSVADLRSSTPTSSNPTSPNPTSTGASARSSSASSGTGTTTATATATSAVAAAATAAETSTATSTASPTATPTEAATATPTEAPTATSTPAPLTYEIQAGDTLLAISNQFGITVDELMTANNLTQSDVLALRPGQELIIPGQSAAPGQSSDSGSQQLQTYIVQSGDTPSSIANRFGVSVDALLAVNGLSAADATRLRTGQELLIPASSSDASNGSDAASATVVTGAADAAPTSASASAEATEIRVDAPILRTPQDGESLQCSRSNSLVWNPTPFITLKDNYVLHLGYVSAFDSSGEAQVQWVLAQQSDSTRTSWEMDSEYCALAPQDLGRQWRWYVEVVDESDVIISPPSEIWAFTWN